MKHFSTVILAVSMVVTLSCTGHKKTSETADKKTATQATAEADETVCSVTLAHANEGCKALLLTRNEPSERTLMPVTLDADLQIEGLRVAVKFRYVRIMQGECKMGQPIAIESIRRL